MSILSKKVENMRIKSNNINALRTINSYFSQDKKNNLISNANTKDNSKVNSFIKSIVDQKIQMNNMMDKMKIGNVKQKLKLDLEKDKCIKDIRDICTKYDKELSTYKGYSPELDSILSGNIDMVTGTMDFKDVDKHITNVEYSIIHGDSDSLKEYYNKGADKNETFANYMNDSDKIDIDGVMSSNKISDGQKRDIGILEVVKDAYKNLYNIMDRIKAFQKESTERLNQLQKNMTNNIEVLKKQRLKQNDIKKGKL